VVYVLLVYTPGEVLVCVLLVCTADGVKRSSLQSVGEHTLALAVVRDAHNMYDVMWAASAQLCGATRSVQRDLWLHLCNSVVQRNLWLHLCNSVVQRDLCNEICATRSVAASVQLCGATKSVTASVQLCGATKSVQRDLWPHLCNSVVQLCGWRDVSRIYATLVVRDDLYGRAQATTCLRCTVL